MAYVPITEGSQCYRIVEHMKEHGKITQMDCLKMNPPILRLASRISDIRKNHGIMVVAEREHRYVEGKEVSHWNSYRIPTEEELTSAEAE